MWDVTTDDASKALDQLISTHTSRVGCDEKPVLEEPKEEISTHTSRVGCDRYI